MHYLRRALEPFAELIEAPLADMLNAAPGRAGAGRRRQRRRGRARGAGALDREGRAADPLRRAAAGAVGRGPARGGSAAAGAAARRRALGRRRDVLGRAAPAEAVPRDGPVRRAGGAGGRRHLEPGDGAARPGPARTGCWRRLEDGTPLVTGSALGDGRVVLFHVTASADWSSLPLSGLFVQMLERLTQSAGGLADDAEALEGTVWTPLQVMDGFGDLSRRAWSPASPGERLARGAAVAGDPARHLRQRRAAGGAERDAAGRPAGAAGAAAGRRGGGGDGAAGRDPARAVADRAGAGAAGARRAGDAGGLGAARPRRGGRAAAAAGSRWRSGWRRRRRRPRRSSARATRRRSTRRTRPCSPMCETGNAAGGRGQRAPGCAG